MPTRPSIDSRSNAQDEMPSRQDAFLTGLTLALCQSSPTLYAYLRDSQMDKEGNLWLIFYNLPDDILADLSGIINVKDQAAWRFQQHSVLHTALRLRPSEEEMEKLGNCYNTAA